MMPGLDLKQIIVVETVTIFWLVGLIFYLVWKGRTCATDEDQ